jgi:STE24 endopeptidase
MLALRWLLARRAVRDTLRVRGITDVAIVPVLWALSAGIGVIGAPVEGVVSRHFERQADQATFELTGDTDTFIEMKKRLARSNRRDLLPHPLVVFWYATHPPVIERIAAAEAYRDATAAAGTARAVTTAPD